MNKRAIAYIDGFNLYSGIMDKNWGKYRWLDLGKMADIVSPDGYEIVCVKYFTTIIKGNQEKHERQQTYLNALRAHLGTKLEITYGRFQLFPSRCKYCEASPVYCNNCGKEQSKPNEKKTDVNIATAMLVDCFMTNTDSIILISGDSDYESPLDQIGKLFPSIYRLIVFPPKRKNPKLEPFCDRHFSLEINHFRSIGLLPNTVINPKSGKKYSKPSSW